MFSQSINSANFVKPESLLPYEQEHASYRYPDLHKSSYFHSVLVP
jgi:hypothetical protein